ncbi:MAG: hypothetical protein HQK62_11065 [Desulfamplus sp.]|nr:hypothetical protein [Desulfamplus sp.]
MLLDEGYEGYDKLVTQNRHLSGQEPCQNCQNQDIKDERIYRIQILLHPVNPEHPDSDRCQYTQETIARCRFLKKQANTQGPQIKLSRYGKHQGE